MIAVEARGLTRRFRDGRHERLALDGVDLDIGAGELVVVFGRSGAGKTTLLNLLGGLDRPTSGTVALDDVELGSLGRDRLAALRRDRHLRGAERARQVPAAALDRLQRAVAARAERGHVRRAARVEHVHAPVVLVDAVRRDAARARDVHEREPVARVRTLPALRLSGSLA